MVIVLNVILCLELVFGDDGGFSVVGCIGCAVALVSPDDFIPIH